MLNFQLVTITLNTLEIHNRAKHLLGMPKEDLQLDNGRFTKFSLQNDSLFEHSLISSDS